MKISRETIFTVTLEERELDELDDQIAAMRRNGLLQDDEPLAKLGDVLRSTKFGMGG